MNRRRRMQVYLGLTDEGRGNRSSVWVRMAIPMADTTPREGAAGLLFGLLLGAGAITLLLRPFWPWWILGGFDLVFIAIPQVFRSVRWFLRPPSDGPLY